MTLPHPLETTTPHDQYFNYCWWKYQPVAPTEGKLRPVNLLWHSFAVAGLGEPAFRLVEAIRSAVGPFRSVYGIKWLGDRLAWEFYFYDYKRRERVVSATRVLEAIAPVHPCRVRVNEALPYFMFSLDILPDVLAGERSLDVVHLYIGNPGSSVSSGIAYALGPAGDTTLENFYFFFDAQRHRDEAAAKICCAAHFDATRVPLDRILWPELRDCHTLCIANKRQYDTVYFSGVTVDQLLFFLRALRYPPPITDFVVAERGRLDHLLYDVGFDYVGRGEDVGIVKSGFYGVF